MSEKSATVGAPAPIPQGVAQPLSFAPPRAPVSRQDRWDARYLQLARQIASWSKDPSTQVGAVLVRAKNTIAGTGYNGFPPGESDDPKLYMDRQYKYAHVIHAEVNALADVSAQDSTGSTLYTSFPCCPACMEVAGKRGVARVVFPPLPKYGRPQSWIEQWEAWQLEAYAKAEQYGITVAIRHV